MLRFDFSHFRKVTDEEIRQVEILVNRKIREDIPLREHRRIPISEARKMGAMALFGEKYGDVVRVVTMGDKSVELCGGTHLDNTAKAGLLSITAEFSVASGVRRIEAITGKSTLDALNAACGNLSVLSAKLKAGSPDELVGKLEQNISVIREMRSKIDADSAKAAGGRAAQLIAGASEISGIKLIASVIDGASADELRQLADSLRDRESGVAAVLASAAGDKITIMAACGKDAVERGVKAGELVKEVSKICGGSGGGKPDFAMGGAKDAGKLGAALEAVDGIVKSMVNI
jgi:alanyl-tRNA synthetase